MVCIGVDNFFFTPGRPGEVGGADHLELPLSSAHYDIAYKEWHYNEFE